jgi:hypothetical protein|nr:MAG TPA: hypothetical protein [Caudoviricetes sp.]
MKNNKVKVEEVLEKMVDIKEHLEKLLKLMDKIIKKSLKLKELKSHIDDFEVFKNDERIQSISKEAFELIRILGLKGNSFSYEV